MRYERALAIADRHEKLIELINSGAYSSRELAEKLDVSEQTIYRDINFFKQRGLSIRSEKHADGWAYHLLAKPTTVPDRKGASTT
jgi:predicted DNA-binding transcriptional regulator YafY